MTYIPAIIFVVTVLVLFWLAIIPDHQESEFLARVITGGAALRGRRSWAHKLFLNPRPVMQILISMLLLGSALYVILSTRYSPQDKHWGYATVGTLLGYWLKAK